VYPCFPFKKYTGASEFTFLTQISLDVLEKKICYSYANHATDGIADGQKLLSYYHNYLRFYALTAMKMPMVVSLFDNVWSCKRLAMLGRTQVGANVLFRNTSNSLQYHLASQPRRPSSACPKPSQITTVDHNETPIHFMSCISSFYGKSVEKINKYRCQNRENRRL
jgi:hypothetical protein